MATREENLKKINDELEKLDDEQLEKIANEKLNDEQLDAVAGGSHYTLGEFERKQRQNKGK